MVKSMFNLFRKNRLPPVIQRAAGLQRDRDFNPPEPSFLETLFGYGSDGRIYVMDAADQRRLRPVFLPDPRAERNREISRRRAASAPRGWHDLPMAFADDPVPVSAPVTAPAPYDFAAAQSDLSPAARAFVGGAEPREFGPRIGPSPVVDALPGPPAAIVGDTARMLASSRWVTIPPRGVGDGRRGG